MRSEVERALADLRVVTKNDDEAIVDNRLIIWANTLQSQIVKNIEVTLEDVIQAS